MAEAKTGPSNLDALICLTCEDLSLQALQFAVTILQALDMRPVLLMVADSSEALAKMNVAQEAIRPIPALRMAQSLHYVGDQETLLTAQLESGGYGLLIMGVEKDPADSPPPWKGHRLAMSVEQDVLLIRNPPEGIRQILICTGGKPGEFGIIRMGLRIAQHTGAQATVLHVNPSPPSMYAGLEGLEGDLPKVLGRDTPLAEHLRRAASLAEDRGVKADMALRQGTVAEEIVRASELGDFDLVVMGAASPSKTVDRWLLDDITPQVLSSTQTSVLIHRPRTTEA